MTIYNSIRVMNTLDMRDVQHETRDAACLHCRTQISI